MRITIGKVFDFLNNIGILHVLNDTIFIKLSYYIFMKEKINLKNPKGFNEKLQWLKLNDRKAVYTKLVDKYQVKQFVTELIGKEYIIPTIGVWDSFDEIKFEELPNKFVLKCTHDSGGVVVCNNKKELNMEETRAKLEKCLSRNFYWVSREWPYKDVKPRIIAEEYLTSDEDGDLKDYKFMCFNGEAKCSFVCSDRFSNEGLKVTFYDREWKKLPFERHYPKSNKDIAKPQNYELMIQLAERLSSNIPFVRVDFYEANEKVYFGEMTFFPGSGLEEFTPKEWDYKLGEMIDLRGIINEKSRPR